MKCLPSGLQPDQPLVRIRVIHQERLLTFENSVEAIIASPGLQEANVGERGRDFRRGRGSKRLDHRRHGGHGLEEGAEEGVGDSPEKRSTLELDLATDLLDHSGKVRKGNRYMLGFQNLCK